MTWKNCRFNPIHSMVINFRDLIGGRPVSLMVTGRFGPFLVWTRVVILSAHRQRWVLSDQFQVHHFGPGCAEHLTQKPLNLCHNDSIGLAGKSMPLRVYVLLVIVTWY